MNDLLGWRSLQRGIDGLPKPSRWWSWDKLAVAALCLAGMVALWTYRDYGISWDEDGQNTYGKLILQYYLSGLRDHSAFEFANLYLYGGGFDLMAAIVNRVSPLDEFEMRHLLGAVVGIAGLACTWRIGRRLGGPRSGVIALALLAVTPNYWGHMFINPKDTPFAAALVATLLVLCKLLDEWPRPGWPNVLGLGLGLGAALGTRIGGLVVIPVLSLPLLVWFVARIQRASWRTALRETGRGLLRLLPAFALAYGVMVLLWPWAGLSWDNPIQAALHFANLDFDGAVLFQGVVAPASEMPRTYLLTLLARTLPEAMLVGLGCAVFLASRAPRSHSQPRSNGRSLGVLAVVGMAVLPLIYFLTVAPTAFNGTRHYLFILPPLAVMAALGIDRLLQRLPHGAARIVAGGFAASLALTIVRMIELHPDEYVYFNDASGGIGAANHHYELDYWGVSLRETTAKLVERLVTANLADPRRPLKVWVCADTLSAAHYFPPWLHVVSDAEEADLVIGLEQFFCPHPSLGHLITSAKRQGVTLSWAGDRTGFVSHSLAQHGETHSGRSSSGGTP